MVEKLLCGVCCGLVVPLAEVERVMLAIVGPLSLHIVPQQVVVVSSLVLVPPLATVFTNRCSLDPPRPLVDTFPCPCVISPSRPRFTAAFLAGGPPSLEALSPVSPPLFLSILTNLNDFNFCTAGRLLL